MTYYVVHWRILKYVLHMIGLWTTYISIPWRFTTSVRHGISNHHVNARITSKIVQFFQNQGLGKAWIETVAWVCCGVSSRIKYKVCMWQDWGLEETLFRAVLWEGEGATTWEVIIEALTRCWKKSSVCLLLSPCWGRHRLLQNYLMDRARNVWWASTHNQTNISQAEHVVSASNWTWTKNDSSAVCTGYFNAVNRSH